ncbi:MAG: hypothetical protein EHM80_03425 [Nitrospiraceae bacterium]|nr:MAG: hypothetical protein EHM80_03425 [Nitrospiraceae bacterium]
MFDSMGNLGMDDLYTTRLIGSTAMPNPYGGVDDCCLKDRGRCPPECDVCRQVLEHWELET